MGTHTITHSQQSNQRTNTKSQQTTKNTIDYEPIIDNWLEINPTYWVLEKYEFHKSFRCKLITFCKGLKIENKMKLCQCK